MEWSLPELQGRRGAGLGNEVIAWVKAYLAAQELGLQLVDPPWRLNPRRYDRDLGGGFASAGIYGILRMLPSSVITVSDFEGTGEVPYEVAVRTLVEGGRINPNSTVLRHASGMSGGYSAIRSGRDWLRSRLLGRVLDASATSDASGIIRIGIHVRRGDFVERSLLRPGDFNVRFPLEWYVDVARSLVDALGGSASLILVTDGDDSAMVDAFASVGVPFTIAPTDVLGALTALAESDVIIASASSFSTLAIFLGNASYVWNRDQLNIHDGGFLSIWGHESGLGGRLTARAIKAATFSSDGRVRAVAQGGSPTSWPSDFLAGIGRFEESEWIFDPIYFGVFRSLDSN